MSGIGGSLWSGICNRKLVEQLVEVNYKAGLKAKSSSAYGAAIEYFEKGSKHLDFHNHYKQLYNFYLERSVCRFLLGQYDQAEAELDEVYAEAQTKLEKLELLFPKVYIYTAKDQKEKAVDVAREGYQLFGRHMPQSKSGILTALLFDLIIAKSKIGTTRIEDLISRPLMQDQENIRFMEFTLAIAPAIYQYNQALFAWNVMRMLFLSLKFGNTGVSSFAYIGFGMLLSQLFYQYRIGKQFADLAIRLNYRLEYAALKWKLLMSYYNFVHHWTHPIKPELEQILEIEHGAYSNGDPVLLDMQYLFIIKKNLLLVIIWNFYSSRSKSI